MIANSLTITDHTREDLGSGLRSIALSREYSSVNYGGDVYHGMSEVDKDLAIHTTVSCVGRSSITVVESFFRLETENDLPTHWIHQDSSVSKWALILYLCDGPGGTAFWKHRATGRISLPKNLNDLPSDIQSDYANIFKHDSEIREQWDMSGFAGLRLGRSVVFPSKIFHSRFPYNSFGTTKEDSRLIFVSFFND